ncbi:MAG TPA: cupin domain-containing protein [Pirellulales bacterium]
MQKLMRTAMLVACGAAIGIGGASLWGHDGHPSAKGTAVRALSDYELQEKLGEDAANATIVEVTLEPGGSSPPHRHPGPVFGYVLEGEYEWAIDQNPAKRLKVGDTFYEPTGVLHRVSRNPQEQGHTRVLAVVLRPRDVKEIVKPEPAAQP